MGIKVMVKMSDNMREALVKKIFYFPVLVTFPWLKGFERENFTDVDWTPCSWEV